MMIHFQNAFVANGTVMSSWRFWSYTFFTNTNCLWNQSAFRGKTRRHCATHIVMKNHVHQQPVPNNQQHYSYFWAFFPPIWYSNNITNNHNCCCQRTDSKNKKWSQKFCEIINKPKKWFHKYISNITLIQKLIIK